eukprot:305081_1
MVTSDTKEYPMVLDHCTDPGSMIVITYHSQITQEALIAIGLTDMDREIHITTNDKLEIDIDLQPLAVSRILENIIAEELLYLVLIGKKAIDDNYGRLKWTEATFAPRL